MLSASRAQTLKPLLDGFVAQFDRAERIAFDPVEFPRRQTRPDDAELVGLLAASLAYGRADLFKPKLAWILERMGPRPAEFARNFEPRRDAQRFRDFVYRFNVGADVATLISAAGSLQREHGSLGAAFARFFAKERTLQPALARFVAALRTRSSPGIEAVLGPPRDLAHMLPNPEGGSSCKRLLLYLRWMIRPSDGVDLGLWPLPPQVLVIPLDTHIARISKFLGFTARKDLSWRTAEEITASLRRLDPDDPVKYDFALCHLGMSGLCPAKSRRALCEGCALLPVCRQGRAVLRRRTS